MAAVNLANFRPVSADESAIMDVSYHLATTGVLGSEIYDGFQGADSHFFINLPTHHLIQAMVLKLIGFGMAQARLISIFFAIGLIWVMGLLARRWYGLAAAFLTTILLLFWRTDLVGASPGLPYLVIGRSARYDIATLFWIWLAIALLDQLLRRPGRWMALALGVVSGLATLTQFYGFFVVVLIALIWLKRNGRQTFKRQETWLMVAGFGLLVLPYILWIFANLGDFQSQMAKYGDRGSFTTAQFWIENLQNEGQRYAVIGRRVLDLLYLRSLSFGPLLLLLVLVPALYALWRREKRTGQGSGGLLVAAIVVFTLCLLIFEQTKAPLYAALLWPAICLAVAAWGSTNQVCSPEKQQDGSQKGRCQSIPAPG